MKNRINLRMIICAFFAATARRFAHRILLTVGAGAQQRFAHRFLLTVGATARRFAHRILLTVGAGAQQRFAHRSYPAVGATARRFAHRILPTVAATERRFAHRILPTVAAAGLLLLVMPAPPAAAEPPATIALHEPDSPFVAFSIWVHAGSQNDPPGKEGLASLTAQVITSGSTNNESYEEIRKRLFPMAAGYNSSSDKEMTVITGRVHRDNLEGFYQIVRDVLLEPGFLEEDFERVHSGRMNYVERSRRFGNDEELSKILLFREAFRGTAYEHPTSGYVLSAQSITLDDVKAFYNKYYVRNNIAIAVGGSYPEGFVDRVRKDFDTLPEGDVAPPPSPAPAVPDGYKITIVEKETDATSISIGFPIALLRGDDGFFPLWTATNWFGVHRNAFARLFQVIRSARGMNYGDYAYIEALPRGYATSRPRVNVARRSQLFEIWIRPVAKTSETDLHDRALFATRCALRELSSLIANGLSPQALSATQDLLRYYAINYGATLTSRLAYAVDDAFYGTSEPGYLQTVRPSLEALTVNEVNDAIGEHLQLENVHIVFITNDAEGLKQKLLSGEPTPISYAGEQSQALLDQDEEIMRFPIPVTEEDITILQIDEVLEG